MDKQQQTQDQCRALAHMARAIAEVYEDYSKFVHPQLVDMVGNRTARLLEEFGDILNGMDAVTEEDEWVDPIMLRARETFPQPPIPTPPAER